MWYRKIYWHRRVLWVGVGCGRGVSQEFIEVAIQEVFQKNQLPLSAIAGIATIDIKANEVGLVEFCRQRNLPLRTFSSQTLKSVSVPNPSTVVGGKVGTPSVAEASALCAAQSQTLVVPKRILRNLSGAVTVAVAQA
jgi:cobalt-precorrin 5A hydrolase/precorrin-3B C17-methyltransferase